MTDCNGMRVLGGHCKYSAGESEKEYKNLPDHDSIRITGQMLFLDTWNKESAYIRVDGQIVWINMHPASGANICGLEEVNDSVLSFDVKVVHSHSKLNLAFGSNLPEEPCEKSFGITGLALWINSYEAV